MMTWEIAALTVSISAITALISAALWHLGVLGVVWRLRRGQDEHNNDIASLEERVNKLFKQRASDASQDARQAKGTLLEEAQHRVEVETPPAASKGRQVPLGFLRR